jgi:GR25 family glycosyltransferase involved in LPS biosynthesis
MTTLINSLTDIKHVFYINLEHRKDRKQHVETQLKSVGITQFERFNAIKLTNGRIGCSMSHLQCLKLAKERNYDHLLICEDDTTFLNPALFTSQINTFFQKGSIKKWDVLLLGGNNVPPYQPIDDTCIRVSHCQTTTCYLVQNHYFDTLIENIKEGIQHLMREPNNHRYYAIDMYWLQLQKKDIWLLIVPLSVIQKEDYSDIEQRRTNYQGMMLDLNKEHLFRR